MKFQFSPNLSYQAEAIASIVDIFEGQEVCRTHFTVAPPKFFLHNATRWSQERSEWIVSVPKQDLW